MYKSKQKAKTQITCCTSKGDTPGYVGISRNVVKRTHVIGPRSLDGHRVAPLNRHVRHAGGKEESRTWFTGRCSSTPAQILSQFQRPRTPRPQCLNGNRGELIGLILIIWDVQDDIYF